MLESWSYGGKYVNAESERIRVECQPSTHGKNSDGVEISVTVGHKTVWLTPVQAEELVSVLRALANARAALA